MTEKRPQEVSVEGLNVYLNGCIVLKNLNINFEKGKVYGILGPNGAGKSTFIKSLARLLETFQGKIIFLGNDLRKYSLKSLSKLRGYLAQREPLVDDLTVLETVLFGRIPYTGFLKDDLDMEFITGLMERLHIRHLAKRKLSEISGGELQRVLLARALAQRPQVLLLDEPINHLDPKNQVEILNFLQSATKDTGLMTVLVLHDVNLALRFCDFLVILKDGVIHFAGPPEKINEEILHKVYEISVKIIHDGKRKVVVFYP